MTTYTFLTTSARRLAGASVVAVAAAGMALPSFAAAATYAYVNTAGEVNAVTASDANTALMTAPNIATHSGVMLLGSQTDPIVNDGVSGV